MASDKRGMQGALSSRQLFWRYEEAASVGGGRWGSVAAERVFRGRPTLPAGCALPQAPAHLQRGGDGVPLELGLKVLQAQLHLLCVCLCVGGRQVRRMAGWGVDGGGEAGGALRGLAARARCSPAQRAQQGPWAHRAHALALDLQPVGVGVHHGDRQVVAHVKQVVGGDQGGGQQLHGGLCRRAGQYEGVRGSTVQVEKQQAKGGNGGQQRHKVSAGSTKGVGGCGCVGGCVGGGVWVCGCVGVGGGGGGGGGSAGRRQLAEEGAPQPAPMRSDGGKSCGRAASAREMHHRCRRMQLDAASGNGELGRMPPLPLTGVHRLLGAHDERGQALGLVGVRVCRLGGRGGAALEPADLVLS